MRSFKRSVGRWQIDCNGKRPDGTVLRPQNTRHKSLSKLFMCMFVDFSVTFYIVMIYCLLELCTAMRDKNVDLLIIEGMGRALHTNLTAEFKCECLKMAVVKNPWLAKRLGGDIFSVIFQYET